MILRRANCAANRISASNGGKIFMKSGKNYKFQKKQPVEGPDSQDVNPTLKK